MKYLIIIALLSGCASQKCHTYTESKRRNPDAENKATCPHKHELRKQGFQPIGYW